MAHDPKKYHPDFARVSWELKTKRAGEQCEYIYPATGNRCEARDWELHPVTGSRVVLSCCHLDHDPSHVDPERLAIYCQLHHNQHDAEERTRQRLAAQRAAEEAMLRAAGQMGLWEVRENES